MNRFCPASTRSSRRGFSLIELLAVVSIIATLAALVFPAYKSALARRDSVVCLSNLRQCYNYYLTETQDNNMTIPLSFDYGTNLSWPDKVCNSLGGNYQISDGGAHAASVFGCPAERKKLKFGFNRRSFGINLPLTDSSYAPDGPPRMTSFIKPSKTALLADAPLKSTGTSVESGFSVSSTKLPDPVHTGYANILFVDGHVSPMSASALTAMVTGTPKGDGSDLSVFWIGH